MRVQNVEGQPSRLIYTNEIEKVNQQIIQNNKGQVIRVWITSILSAIVLCILKAMGMLNQDSTWIVYLFIVWLLAGAVFVTYLLIIASKANESSKVFEGKIINTFKNGKYYEATFEFKSTDTINIGINKNQVQIDDHACLIETKKGKMVIVKEM